ncbi:MAG: hypothetical protein A2X36_03970 [Elusimicrobia bacterium GWA2_69_24]|nr:MAG: hypothetical protein A2X36_03970 [Elusimicrobia bacterium GWA2_69_24]HBL16066.1 hypothetical protein [Elusimicrobiota bacterium]
MDAPPLHPRKTPPYRVHWNWEIFKACNYRCPYCPTYDNAAPSLRLPVSEWKTVWDRLFVRYGSGEIRFTGGEPTLYPDFLPLVGRLQERHTVNITTNLSFDAQAWIAAVRPENVFLSASLHLDHVSAEDFLAKLLLLWKHRHYATVAFVAYPPHLPRLKELQRSFQENGIIFKIIPFNGEYGGKRYPDDYSPEERALMDSAIASSAEPGTRKMNQALQGFALKEAAAEAPLCRMGEMYAKIEPDGTVRRCCSIGVEALGRITDEDLRLYDDPKACSAPCKCWKAMVVGRYEAQAKDLWHMPEHTIHKLGPS